MNESQQKEGQKTKLWRKRRCKTISSEVSYIFSEVTVSSGDTVTCFSGVTIRPLVSSCLCSKSCQVELILGANASASPLFEATVASLVERRSFCIVLYVLLFLLHIEDLDHVRPALDKPLHDRRLCSSVCRIARFHKSISLQLQDLLTW